MFPGKRHLLLGLAVCAILQIVSTRTRRITPAFSEVPVALEGSFQVDGQYPGEAFAYAAGVRAWGSWSGSDDHEGTVTIGPFFAPRVLRLGMGGYPGHEGNSLRVELADGSESIPLKPAAVGERWDVAEFELPSSWANRPVRIVGRDQGKGVGGWFAITEPIRGGRSDGNSARWESLAAFAINGLLLGILYGAAVRLLGRLNSNGGTAGAQGDRTTAAAPCPDQWRKVRSWSLAPHWIPLGAGAIVALCGYVAFWAYFTHALLGTIFSWSALGIALITHLRPRERHATTRSPDVSTVLTLMLAIGAFHLALLHLFPTPHDFYTLAANRYREALPSDNALPHGLAERLFAGQPARNPADAWLSSDRPPLQSGWQLLTWPAGKVLDLDRRNAGGTSAVWFQLLWVAAAYGLLRTLKVDRARTAGWIAVLALAGFFVQNTTFTWPKLSAGAFACGAFAVLLLPARDMSSRANGFWSAAFAGLAWLSHGGVAFSLLPLVPWVAWRAARGEWRAWLPGAAVFLALALPWLAYQKFYDPPGDMLLKLHLGGQLEADPRGTWQTIRDAYAQLGWREAWANKVSNFHAQVFGDWRYLTDVSPATMVDRRNQEFFHSGRALTWWPVLALFALVLARRRVLTPARELGTLAAWLGVTIVVWCLLMFGRYQAVIHHGSYALMIGLFVLFSVLLERAGRGWLGVIAVLQAITLGTTWAMGNALIHGPATGLPFVATTGLVLAGFVIAALRSPDSASPRSPAAETSAVPTSTVDRWLAAFRAWWVDPRLNFWVLGALALLLFLRKPHALHTPQLWAEDGSIFLMQADLHGASALTIPYMGYLHTLPRLIASLAPRLLDPAWWPAFYNGISFVVWLAVLARLFTARFPLPGKPWLALALIAVPHTGEVFFNITNLQWLTAFVLIQQALILPPKTSGERVADLVILALVTLTGPFGIAFLPLFVWRWWRDRRRDNAAALGVMLVGAAVQAWFVVRTGPRFEFQSEPLNLWSNLVILARRLIVFPAVGRDAALAWPPLAIAGIGGTFLVLLIVWALRPHPRRILRAQLVVALGLITLAAVYRTRPDTWAADNLDYGDRYFYIPRVLLAWLLIWEFDAVPRASASAARVFCLLVVLTHLREYTVPAPINYHWAAQVEPIRRGIPADLPTLPEGWSLEYRGRPKKDG